VTTIDDRERPDEVTPAERHAIEQSVAVKEPRSVLRTLLKEVSAFGVVGAVGLGVDLGVFNLLFSSGQVIAKCISTTAAMVVTYLGNRYLSFSHRSRSTVNREAFSFVVVNVVALMLSVVILALFEYPLHLKGDKLVMNIVNLATIGAGTSFRFWAYRRYVFRQPGLHLPNLHIPEMHLPELPHLADLAHMTDAPHDAPATET
jgi:putative flippase GtrA